MILSSSTCFANNSNVKTLIGNIREQQILAREIKEEQQYQQILIQEKNFIDNNADVIDQKGYRKIRDTVPGITNQQQASIWARSNPKAEQALIDPIVKKMMKEAGIVLPRSSRGSTKSIVNLANKELIAFIQKEKNLSSRDEAKQWVASHPKEAETIKYYLIGQNLSANERQEVCKKLLSTIIPATFEMIKKIDKVLTGEIPPPNMSLSSYKELVDKANQEIASKEIPQQWYWAILSSIIRSDIREDFFFKELLDCPDILHRTPHQIVEEFAG